MIDDRWCSPAPVAVLLALLLAAPMARAEESGPGPHVLAALPLGLERCYARDFRPTKKQAQLTRLMVYRLLRPNPSYEYVEDSAKAIAARDKELVYSLSASVLAHFNDTRGDYTQSVECHDTERGFTCGVDCDGGSFTVDMDKGALTLGFGPYGLVVQGGCADEGVTTRLLAGKNVPEKARLVERPVEACLAADRDSTLSFARELTSLRERIATLGWRCLKRSYPAEHMRKNPGQQVKSLAVSLKLIDGKNADGVREVSLKAIADVKLRDGKHARKLFDCNAGQYEFTCGSDFRLKRRSADSALLISGGWEPEPGSERSMMGLALGAGDDVFKLAASASPSCDAD